jgi:hypothetical protein
MRIQPSPLFVAIVLAAGAGQAQSLPAATDLTAPAGSAKRFEFQTLPTSVQIYTCKASTDHGFIWGGPDPDAILVSRDKSVTVHHYKGPTWEATDGALVKGSNAKHFQASREKSVDWLELAAKGGTGSFARVTWIHRIETEGGLAPDPGGCDAAHVGEQVRVPYRATYEFYGAN